MPIDQPIGDYPLLVDASPPYSLGTLVVTPTVIDSAKTRAPPVSGIRPSIPE